MEGEREGGREGWREGGREREREGREREREREPQSSHVTSFVRLGGSLQELCVSSLDVSFFPLAADGRGGPWSLHVYR